MIVNVAPGWSAVPVDDVGYFESSELLQKTDEELKELIFRMRRVRYGGWRNHEGKWRDIMALGTGGRVIWDYGCGTGMEALELARAGNQVRLWDAHRDNVRLARRVLIIHGFREYPGTGPFDTVHMSGVLHHIRRPQDVMRGNCRLLKPGGDVRLMLYSDQGWRIATGTEPPDDVEQHPQFWQFVRFFDAVGDYADWYDADRLEQRFGQWFTLERAEYMTPDRRYLGAVMRRRG